jgi:hypothetical protein
MDVLECSMILNFVSVFKSLSSYSTQGALSRRCKVADIVVLVACYHLCCIVTLSFTQQRTSEDRCTVLYSNRANLTEHRRSRQGDLPTMLRLHIGSMAEVSEEVAWVDHVLGTT